MNHIDTEHEHISSLDGLKGLCACIIAFIWHYQHFQPASSPFYSIFKLCYDHGDLAVEIFFMLSGFGILLGYERRICDGSISGAEFWSKRIRKLYPPMILSTIVTAVLQWLYLHRAGNILQYPGDRFDAYHFVLNILGLQYGILETEYSFNGPLWFIGVLMLCYFIFYLTVRLSRNNQWLLNYIYIIIAILGCVLVVRSELKPALNFMVGRGLSCFFIGCLIARVHQYREHLRTTLISTFLLAFIVLNMALSLLIGYEVIGNTMMYMIIAFAPATILISVWNPVINRLLSIKPCLWLGQISMEIFFWHFPIQIIWKTVDIYLGLNIDYSSRLVWMGYAVSVILFSAIYSLLLNSRKNNINPK